MLFRNMKSITWLAVVLNRPSGVEGVVHQHYLLSHRRRTAPPLTLQMHPPSLSWNTESRLFQELSLLLPSLSQQVAPDPACPLPTC